MSTPAWIRSVSTICPARLLRGPRLGLPADVPILLYVGFSTPRKGLEYLAQALGCLPPEVHLLMAGKWEAGYRERFLGLLGPACSRVHMLGYVPDAVLPAYFSAANVFVLPTLLEGFGIPLVEAMMAGLPIVTTSAGSAGEVTGDAGLVVPPADVPALAGALTRVIQDPALSARLVEAGKQRVLLFTVERVGAELEVVYGAFCHSQEAGR